MQVEQMDTWAASIPAKPGGLASKLDALSKANVNLEFVISRRTPEKAGEGVVFVTPVKGDAGVRAAKDAGFDKSETMHTLRIESDAKPGEGARIAHALGEQGVNLRGFSAAALGRKFVAFVALDSADDEKKAMGILQRL
ncbi:MAG TPA: amino acid-binding protein [Verrucomicrobiae bacterium]|nr:amino acid-binding protein [Verrucomicrobiae bacterium]